MTAVVMHAVFDKASLRTTTTTTFTSLERELCSFTVQQLTDDMVHHQFDDLVYAQQQQPHPSYHCSQQLMSAAHQYGTATTRTSAGGDYVVYSGNGCGDIAARSPCYQHRGTTYVIDAGNQHRPPSSLQNIYHRADFGGRNQAGSECVVVGSEDSDQSGPCWGYPSTGGDAADSGDGGLTAGWAAGVGRAYGGGCFRSYDLPRHSHPLQNPDGTLASVYRDIPATAAVTTATSCRLLQQSSPTSVVTHHLMDADHSQRNHQLVAPDGAGGNIAWTGFDAPFRWMKKQTLSPITPTGTHIHDLLLE